MSLLLFQLSYEGVGPGVGVDFFFTTPKPCYYYKHKVYNLHNAVVYVYCNMYKQKCNVQNVLFIEYY